MLKVSASVRSKISLFPSAAGLLLICFFSAHNLVAQPQRSADLLDYFVKVRTLKLADRDTGGYIQRLPPRSAELLKVASDTLRAWIENIRHDRLAASLPPALETFSVDSWDVIGRLRAPLYKPQFSSTKWAFTGSNSRSTLDTMKTADLRARLQFQFGSPTITLAEVGYPDSLARDEVIEFEYWFVLNDSVNVIVMDVNGPWDRGIVLAADMRFRSELQVIKRSFLGQLLRESSRKPFTDYYFNYDQQMWYLTGYDGARFFDERIQRPDLRLGRPAPVVAPSTEIVPKNQQ